MEHLSSLYIQYIQYIITNLRHKYELQYIARQKLLRLKYEKCKTIRWHKELFCKIAVPKFALKFGQKAIFYLLIEL